MKELFRLASRQTPRLALSALMMAFVAVGTAAYAFLVGPVVGALFKSGGGGAALELTGPGNPGMIAERLVAAGPGVVGLTVLVVAAVKGMAHLSEQLLTAGAVSRVLARLRLDLYADLLRASPLDERGRQRGALAATFTVDVEAVELGIRDGIVGYARNGLQVAALVALVVALDPLLGLAGLVVLPLLGGLIASLSRRLKTRRAAVHEAFSRVSQAVDETAAGLDVVRAFCAEKNLQERFTRHNEGLRKAVVRAVAARSMSAPINEILGGAGLIAALLLAESRIQSGALSPEGFLSFFSALLLLYQPIKALGRSHQNASAATAALERLRVEDADKLTFENPPSPLFQGGNIRETYPLAPSLKGRGTIAETYPLAPSLKGRGTIAETYPLAPSLETCAQDSVLLRVRGAVAGYGDGPDVLRGLDLDLAPGERVAVVGTSGAGKTTLLHLLLGFLPPRGGFVSLPPGARPAFAPVFQEPFLFDDTIAVNVACGRPEASRNELEGVCRTAGVLDFADALPLGLDAPVGPEGSRLSVGQRQRVCLARALLSEAPIILLDEPTAALDGETEATLVRSIDEALRDRAAVIITHRAEMTRIADRVLRLESGALEPWRGLSDSRAQRFQPAQALRIT